MLDWLQKLLGPSSSDYSWYNRGRHRGKTPPKDDENGQGRRNMVYSQCCGFLQFLLTYDQQNGLISPALSVSSIARNLEPNPSLLLLVKERQKREESTVFHDELASESKGECFY